MFSFHSTNVVLRNFSSILSRLECVLADRSFKISVFPSACSRFSRFDWAPCQMFHRHRTFWSASHGLLRHLSSYFMLSHVDSYQRAFHPPQFLLFDIGFLCFLGSIFFGPPLASIARPNLSHLTDIDIDSAGEKNPLANGKSPAAAAF